MNKKQLNDFYNAMVDLGDAHTMLLRTPMDKTDSEPISILLSKAKYKLFNILSMFPSPTPEVGKTMAELVYKCVGAENYERWNTGARDGVLKAMSEWASLQCEAKDTEIKELREALGYLMKEYKNSVEEYCKNNNITWDALYKMGLPSYQKAEQALNKKP